MIAAFLLPCCLKKKGRVFFQNKIFEKRQSKMIFLWKGVKLSRLTIPHPVPATPATFGQSRPNFKNFVSSKIVHFLRCASLHWENDLMKYALIINVAWANITIHFVNKKFSLVLVWHSTALASIIARITFGCRSIIFRLASVGHVYQVWSRIFFHIIIVRFDFDFALSVQNGSRGFWGQDS